MNVLSKECSSENSLKPVRNSLIIGASALLIFFVTILVYLPALENGFVWDDIQYVIENERIRSLEEDSLRVMFTTFYVGNWHPLTWISHAIDYKLWGLDATGHHLTNIVLHGLNALVVFLLVLKLAMLAQELNASTPPSQPLWNTTIQPLIAAGVAAIIEIKRSLAVRPNNINAHNKIALAYYSQGKYKLALAHFDRVISLGGHVNQQLMEFLKSYR